MNVTTCKLCRQEITRDQFPRALRAAHTWTEPRRGGGQHALIAPTMLNEWAHQECIWKLKRGTLGQGELI